MARSISFPGLPVEETFDRLRRSLCDNLTAILEAPPGAGKTTLVPLALLEEDWLQDQKIIVLEPRRLAARMAARRMADLLGESVGETVGYRIRQDKKVSPRTRIEVVTEGILTRLIQKDPELNGIGLVIFDEFHERNLQGDLGLAFCLETQTALRDNLRLLIMSATLDGEHLSNWLDGAPVISSQGRAYDVACRYLKRPDKFNLAHDVAAAVRQALREETGNILVFLPGEGEIRKTQSLLEGTIGAMVCPLYGALPPQEQDKAIAPPQNGQRKVVLATTIAETSLTIQSIRIVIDCGLKRVARFDGARGLSKLETVRVSKASATQRMGRAGRLEDGVCYRLWPESENHSLSERDRAEILDADLAPFALELASWGLSTPEDLQLLDQPEKGPFEGAQNLLQQLGALDQDLRLTSHGKQMSELSLHPRLAHMVLASACQNAPDGALACDIAAVLQDGPIFKGKHHVDLRDSISALQGAKSGQGSLSKAALHRAKDTAKSLKRKLNLSKIQTTSAMETGRVLALSYPDRIAKLRGKGQAHYLLSAGMGASLDENDPLFGEEFLVVADMGGTQAQGRIFSAAPVQLTELEDEFSDLICDVEIVDWDNQKQAAIARRDRKLGALSLSSKPLKDIPEESLQKALCKGIGRTGLHVLPWSKEATQLRQRLQFLHQQDDSWPDVSDQALLERLENWLLPFLQGCTRLDHLKKLDIENILLSQLSWEDQQKLNERAPTHYRVPSGSHIRLDYTSPQKPVLAVKLQEMFGEPDTPRINQDKCRLQIHLLSPAGRPLQVTENLESFWRDAYDSVKKEMKGRYPKHPWPDNPMEAIATGKTKRHL